MTTPVELDDYSFEEKVLKSAQVVLVDFWAPWCGPCKLLGPVVEEIAEEMSDKIVVAKVNVDDNPIVAGRFKIMSIPTMLIFKDGKIVDHLVGAQPKDTIIKRIESALN